MTKLQDLATVIRSKNAGPLTLSLDLMFPSEESYQMALRSSALTAETIGRLYNTAAEKISITSYDAARAIKIAMPRKIVSNVVPPPYAYCLPLVSSAMASRTKHLLRDSHGSPTSSAVTWDQSTQDQPT